MFWTHRHPFRVTQELTQTPTCSQTRFVYIFVVRLPWLGCPSCRPSWPISRPATNLLPFKYPRWETRTARREEIEFYSQISESKILANWTTTRPSPSGPTHRIYRVGGRGQVDVQWPVKMKTQQALLDLLVYILFGMHLLHEGRFWLFMYLYCSLHTTPTRLILDFILYLFLRDCMQLTFPRDS